MTEGPSETASPPTQAERPFSQVLEDAMHFTQNMAAGATSAVVHSPEHATRALEEARHLAEELTHQAENVVHSIEHLGEQAVHQAQDVREVLAHTPEHAATALEEARHLAEEVIEHLGEQAVHQAQDVREVLAHTPEHAATALEEARHLAEEVTHKAENVVHSIEHLGEHAAEEAVHGTEGAVHSLEKMAEEVVHSIHAATALEDARHFAEDAVHQVEHTAEEAVHGTEGAVHSLEKMAEEVVHSIEHFGQEAVHNADGVRSAVAHTPQHASQVLQEAKSLAGGAVHQVQEAMHTMGKAPERTIANFIFEENRRLKAQIENANQRAGEAQAPLQHALGMLAREQQERQRLEQVVVQMQIEGDSRGTMQAFLEESGVEVHVMMQALRRSGMSAAQLLDFLVAVENAPGMRGGDGLAPGMIGVTELLWRHPGMTVGRLNDMLDGRSKAAERELELEQKSANAAREVGKLKSEVSRLQARLVGSVSRVEHVKAIKEREDVIASMVSAEEMERGTQLLQEKCDLLKKEIAEYEKGPKTVPASEHVLALQEARRKMASMVSLNEFNTLRGKLRELEKETTATKHEVERVTAEKLCINSELIALKRRMLNIKTPNSPAQQRSTAIM